MAKKQTMSKFVFIIGFDNGLELECARSLAGLVIMKFGYQTDIWNIKLDIHWTLWCTDYL